MLQSCIPTVSLTLFLHVSKAPWIPRFPIQCVIFTPKPQGFLLFPTSVCGTILHLVFPLSHSQLKFYWFCLLSISVGIPPLLFLSIASVLIWATIIFFFFALNINLLSQLVTPQSLLPSSNLLSSPQPEWFFESFNMMHMMMSFICSKFFSGLPLAFFLWNKKQNPGHEL